MTRASGKKVTYAIVDPFLRFWFSPGLKQLAEERSDVHLVLAAALTPGPG